MLTVASKGLVAGFASFGGVRLQRAKDDLVR